MQSDKHGGRCNQRFDDTNPCKEEGEFVDTEGIEIGRIIHPLRVAATGKSIGFGPFDAPAILGRRRCPRRIERAISNS